MPLYIPVAFLAAAAIASNAVMTKVLIRYRLCSSTLVGLLSATGSGVCAIAGALVFRLPFPVAAWQPLLALAMVTILAMLFLVHALQEGDVSTVVPVMGIKIPLASLLAALFLGERHPAIVYVAVLVAAAAVALFGLGNQKRSQGGHDRHPALGMGLAIAAATCYAIADLFAKVAVDLSDPLTTILWVWILVGAFCFALSFRKTYRQYRISVGDRLLFVFNGALVVVAIGSLYWSFSLADGVTVPNIIFATRGFFALLASIALSRLLSVPFEKQSGGIYGLRTLGTLLMFLSILLGILFR